jgi:hypothetical protein
MDRLTTVRASTSISARVGGITTIIGKRPRSQFREAGIRVTERAGPEVRSIH